MGRSLGLVGACIVLSGLLVQLHLALVARHVSPEEYGWFGTFWSLALVVSFGVFLPMEQELARLGGRANVRPAARVALGMAAVQVVLLAATAPLLLDPLGGDLSALAALVTLSIVSAGQFLLRGLLIGERRMGTHGLLLVLDTTVRVLLALAVGWLLPGTASWFAWTVVVAIALVHVPLLVRLVVPKPEGDAVAPRAFARAVGPLLVGSLCAQVLLNGVPVLVAAIAVESEQAAAGQFLAAFLLVRVPLFVAVPLQTALLPSLIDPAKARGVLIRLTLGLLVAGAVGVAGAATVGSALVRLVFGPAYQVAAGDLVLLTLGVTAHLGLIVITQALVASARHKAVAWSWLTGIAAAGVVFAAVPDLFLRAELAFLVGSAAGWLVGVGALFTAGNDRSKRRGRSGDRPDVLHALRVGTDERGA